MIKISQEDLMTLAEAACHLPRRRRGKRPAVQTMYRWAQKGVRGIRLETIQVGGTKCTSLEALQRFCERLSESSFPALAESPAAHDRRRDREKARAERECRSAGI